MTSRIFVNVDIDELRSLLDAGKGDAHHPFSYFSFSTRYTKNYKESRMPAGWTVAGKEGADAGHYISDLRDALASAGLDAAVTAVDPNMEGSAILPPVHLGSGEQGEQRRAALEALAAEADCEWGGKPSIGRWIVSLADKQIASETES